MADDENKEPTKGDDVQVESFSDPELSPSAGSGDAQNIDLLLDVPLALSVELGRTRMVVNDLLQLGQGSVVELQKVAGEPLEILVNEKLIARGEVVVVNEKFAIRVTDIISPKERIESLT